MSTGRPVNAELAITRRNAPSKLDGHWSVRLGYQRRRHLQELNVFVLGLFHEKWQRVSRAQVAPGKPLSASKTRISVPQDQPVFGKLVSGDYDLSACLQVSH